MKKDKIFEILNNVKVDEPRTKEIINDIEMHNIKRTLSPKLSKKKKFNWLPKAVVAATLIIGFMFTSPGQELYASMMKVYDNIVVSMNKHTPYPEEVDDIIMKPHSQIIDKGILISIEEIVLDDSVLNINLISEIIEPELYPEFHNNTDISIFPDLHSVKINGINSALGGRGSGWNLTKTISQNLLETNLSTSIDENSNIELFFNKVSIMQQPESQTTNPEIISKDIKGNWRFEFKGEELLKNLDTITHPIDQVIGEIDGKPVYVDYLRSNKFRITMVLKREENARENIFPVEIIATDNQNREYIFSTITANKDTVVMEYVGKKGEALLAQNELTIKLFIQEIPEKSESKMPDQMSAGEPMKIILQK
ncbi:MAG: hypothetical protein GXZ11_04210 [Tissierellia bacterium]|nr:hypothetical protein [Tissierellia bacterium]